MATSLSRLTFSTRANECYDVLKNAILNLDLRPGAPLEEVQIAKQLGISKTPVREALARLSGEGFVISQPGRRMRVAELSLKEISEIYRVRIMVESESLREITPTLSREDVDILDQFVAASATAAERDDLKAYVDSNEQFHEFLIERTDNQYLIGIARQLFDQAHRVRAALYQAGKRDHNQILVEEGMRNHKAILAAIIDRDPPKAAFMMRSDIQMFLDTINTSEIQKFFEELSFSGAVDGNNAAG